MELTWNLLGTKNAKNENLIFETGIRKAKPLPDFRHSDNYLVHMVLPGDRLKERMLAMFRKIDKEIMDGLSTQELMIINLLFHGL